MTFQPTPETIDQWLSAATRGLPTSATSRVCEELKAHYDDAVEDHQMHGKTPAESEQAALSDLGDPGATSKALREAHFARRWYIAAAVVGLLFPILEWFGIALSETSMPYALSRPISDIFILSPIIFVLVVFRKLMAQRAGSRIFDGPVACLMAGVIVSNGALDLRLAFFPSLEHSVWMAGDGSGLVLLGLAIAGVIAVGLGLLWLVIRLSDLRDSLYGLRIPLIVLAVILALALLGFGLSLLQSAIGFAYLSNMIAMAVNLILIALMALLFFRAAYRPTGQRVRAA